MDQLFLSLGSNMGNRAENLRLARTFLESRLGKVMKISSIYQTSAWGKTDQPDFFNQVIEIETDLYPEKILDKILGIENQLGRVRNEKWGPRVIDIDILLIGNQIISQRGLSIPHPSLPERKFVLIPLQEIAPEVIHPILNKTIGELLILCTDASSVEKLASNLYQTGSRNLG